MSGAPARTVKVADAEVAGEIVAAKVASSGALDRMLGDVQGRLDAATFSQLAHCVGAIMGHDMHDLLMNLLAQHPHLDTHGLLRPNSR